MSPHRARGWFAVRPGRRLPLRTDGYDSNGQGCEEMFTPCLTHPPGLVVLPRHFTQVTIAFLCKEDAFGPQTIDF